MYAYYLENKINFQGDGMYMLVDFLADPDADLEMVWILVNDLNDLSDACDGRTYVKVALVSEIELSLHE